jgi:hypothetical protein
MSEFPGLEIELDRSREHSGSFFYWSIPLYWIREMRLVRKAVGWVPVEATVESAHRTKGGYKQTIRAEMYYQYSFRGELFSGHVIRDTCWAVACANALVDDHPSGQKIDVRVNPKKPEESYYPSGFRSLEPFLTLWLSLGCTILVAAIITVFLIIPMVERIFDSLRR